MYVFFEDFPVGDACGDNGSHFRWLGDMHVVPFCEVGVQACVCALMALPIFGSFQIGSKVASPPNVESRFERTGKDVGCCNRKNPLTRNYCEEWFPENFFHFS